MQKMKLWRSAVVAVLVISLLSSLLTLPLTALSPEPYDPDTSDPPAGSDSTAPLNPDAPQDTEDVPDPDDGADADDEVAPDAPQDTEDDGAHPPAGDAGNEGNNDDTANQDGAGNVSDPSNNTPDAVDPDRPDGEDGENSVDGATLAEQGTPGLVFELNSDEQGYTVTGYTGTDAHVVIPASYMGLPVTYVAKGALTDGQVGGSGEIQLPPDYVDGGAVKPSLPDTNKIKSVTLLSTTVTLQGSRYTIPSGATVYGYAGSTAATYALRFGMTFVALDNLVFALNGERTSYSLTGYQGNVAELIVPAVYIGLPVTAVAQDAFRDQTSLVSVSISEGVSSIESGAFYGCKRLESLSLPSTVEYIGAVAFGNCRGLTAVAIPAGTINVEPDAFAGCVSVRGITVDEANTVYHAQGNCLIQTASKTLVIGCGTSEIPTDGSVTRIGVGAFSGCAGMTKLILSGHVEAVDERAFEYAELEELHFLSADTRIFDDAATIPETTVIYGYADSTAQAYAENYGREFVELPAYTPGDIDGVEGVDTDDAIYLLFHSFYPSKYPVDQPCDFNQDGTVDTDDAIYLLFYTFYPAKYPLP